MSGSSEAKYTNGQIKEAVAWATFAVGISMFVVGFAYGEGWLSTGQIGLIVIVLPTIGYIIHRSIGPVIRR